MTAICSQCDKAAMGVYGAVNYCVDHRPFSWRAVTETDLNITRHALRRGEKSLAEISGALGVGRADLDLALWRSFGRG